MSEFEAAMRQKQKDDQQTAITVHLQLMLEHVKHEIDFCLAGAPKDLRDLVGEYAKGVGDWESVLLSDLLLLAANEVLPQQVANDQNRQYVCQEFRRSALWPTLQLQFQKYAALTEMSKKKEFADQALCYQNHRKIITKGTGIWACFCEKLEKLFRSASEMLGKRKCCSTSACSPVRLFGSDQAKSSETMTTGAEIRTRDAQTLRALLLQRPTPRPN